MVLNRRTSSNGKLFMALNRKPLNSRAAVHGPETGTLAAQWEVHNKVENYKGVPQSPSRMPSGGHLYFHPHYFMGRC